MAGSGGRSPANLRAWREGCITTVHTEPPAQCPEVSSLRTQGSRQRQCHRGFPMRAPVSQGPSREDPSVIGVTAAARPAASTCTGCSVRMDLHHLFISSLKLSREPCTRSLREGVQLAPERHERRPRRPAGHVVTPDHVELAFLPTDFKLFPSRGGRANKKV